MKYYTYVQEDELEIFGDLLSKCVVFHTSFVFFELLNQDREANIAAGCVNMTL